MERKLTEEGINGFLPSEDPFQGRFNDVESEKRAAAKADAINKAALKVSEQPFKEAGKA
jgi:hypothetical protein